MMRAQNWRCGVLATAYALGTLASLTSCQRTLVFAEHDGLNLAIRADPKTSPPFEVNMGFERAVGTIVPAIRHSSSDGSADGDAVNMFAGFQVDRGENISPATGPRVDLRIATQFASGAAALAISDDPNAVARIVNVSRERVGVPIPESILSRVTALSRRIASLSPQQSSKAIRDLGLGTPPAEPELQRRVLRLQLIAVSGDITAFENFERNFIRSVTQ